MVFSIKVISWQKLDTINYAIHVLVLKGKFGSEALKTTDVRSFGEKSQPRLKIYMKMNNQSQVPS